MVPTVDLLREDSRFHSRKLWLCVAGMAVVVGLALATTVLPTLTLALPYAVSGVVGLAAVYCGGNVAVKLIAASLQKAEVAAGAAGTEPEG